MTEQAIKPASEHFGVADAERRIKAIFIGSIGNLVEWYDFYAYTAFALYFAPAFFPTSDPVVQQLNAAVLFAATFLMRPLGGWLFGYLADHFGRRLSLTLSVVCMCFGSLMIAVTRTYASIGFAAPAILALARVIEGLSLGGEYGASATYLSEVADANHRGFYSSFQYVTLIGGQLAAILVLLVLQKLFLTDAEIKDWGWRIPFVIGALLAIVAAVMRSELQETDAFEEAKKRTPARANEPMVWPLGNDVATCVRTLWPSQSSGRARPTRNLIACAPRPAAAPANAIATAYSIQRRWRYATPATAKKMAIIAGFMPPPRRLKMRMVFSI